MTGASGEGEGEGNGGEAAVSFPFTIAIRHVIPNEVRNLIVVSPIINY
jgi:hypothetical protein